MSGSGRHAKVQALLLDDDQLAGLAVAADLFDELGGQVPATDGPYSAAQFVEWLRLEMRGRGYHQRGDQRENRRAGQQLRQNPRSLAAAG